LACHGSGLADPDGGSSREGAAEVRLNLPLPRTPDPAGRSLPQPSGRIKRR
jgi:hypothetical protein